MCGDSSLYVDDPEVALLPVIADDTRLSPSKQPSNLMRYDSLTLSRFPSTTDWKSIRFSITSATSKEAQSSAC
jgi:hypothetical protein